MFVRLNVPQRVIQSQTGMSDSEFAMLDTTYSVGGLCGALAAGPIQDKLGRKRAILLMDLIYILSFFVSYAYADNLLSIESSAYVWLWAGRFINGLSAGAACGHVPTYLGGSSSLPFTLPFTS